jgi:hypothetical protein
MQRHGLDFLRAVHGFGAYVDDGKEYHWRDRPRTLSARDSMEMIAIELNVIWPTIADVRRGIVPTDDAWQQFLHAVGRVQFLAGEFRT